MDNEEGKQMSVITTLDGISRFFQWLYVGAVSTWNSFSIFVILLVFIGVQIGFIYLYIKIGTVVMIIQPKIKELLYRIDRFFS